MNHLGRYAAYHAVRSSMNGNGKSSGFALSFNHYFILAAIINVIVNPNHPEAVGYIFTAWIIWKIIEFIINL